MIANYFKETYVLILVNWAHKWNMCFSPSKCEFLRITNNKDVIYSQYSIQNSQIREVQQAKYLSVTLNSKLTWSDHIQAINEKANSTYGFIRRKFNSRPTNIKSSLYLSLVTLRPTLEYAAPSGHHMAKRTSNSLKLSREEQLDLLLTVIQDIRVLQPSYNS